MRISLAACCYCLLGISSLGFGAEKIEPVLPANPEVEKILAGLGDNSSAMLPPAALLGEFGEFAKQFNLDKTGPQGRDFSIKMVWMPDRQRVFYCGANHGSPHRLNDAWEYDLASNTWVLLYDPDYNDGKRLVNLPKAGVTLNEDGILVTAKGGPVHVAHTWWGLTYDPQLKAAVWVCEWPPYGMPEKLAHVKAEKSALFKGPPLWAFFLETKKWQPIISKGFTPRSMGLAGSLEYIPELGGSLWYHRDAGTWLFDSKTNHWKPLKPDMNGLSAIGTIENVMCYDTKNKILIAHRGNSEEGDNKRFIVKQTYHYDVAKNAWTKTVEDKNGPVGHDARTPFYYDPVGEVALLVERSRQKIWSYSVKDKKWTELAPVGPPMPKWRRATGYYDPARNVLVMMEGKSVWVYRYKRAAE